MFAAIVYAAAATATCPSLHIDQVAVSDRCVSEWLLAQARMDWDASEIPYADLVDDEAIMDQSLNPPRQPSAERYVEADRQLHDCLGAQAVALSATHDVDGALVRSAFLHCEREMKNIERALAPEISDRPAVSIPAASRLWPRLFQLMLAERRIAAEARQNISH
jgi:hypothetical protein